MHTHKIVYIKTFKIAPTCFDHTIITRELRCSLAVILARNSAGPWWWSHDL